MKIYDLEMFSKIPFGRYKADGPHSGEAFREILREQLTDAMKSHDSLTIKLDNVFGLGSSFLEESFGGLVRTGLFTKEELLTGSPRLLNFETEHDFYIEEIEDYINTANRLSNN
jgi:hypothetical protein